MISWENTKLFVNNWSTVDCSNQDNLSALENSSIKHHTLIALHLITTLRLLQQRAFSKQ